MSARVIPNSSPMHPTTHGRIVATRQGKPAHLAFTGRVTASAINEHGSYHAARMVLEGRK